MCVLRILPVFTIVFTVGSGKVRVRVQDQPCAKKVVRRDRDRQTDRQTGRERKKERKKEEVSGNIGSHIV